MAVTFLSECACNGQTFNPAKNIDFSNVSSIPYGKPLCNQAMHILNDSLLPCPVNTTGEIYIGRYGVADGYIKQEISDVFMKTVLSISVYIIHLLYGIQKKNFPVF